MFEFVRNNNRLIQIVLAVMMVPFAFWGIDSYVRSNDSSREIANVGGQAIGTNEFNEALRNQQAQMRSMFGKSYDPERFDTPESRQQLINSLIERRLVALEAARGNLTMTDDMLRESILAIGPFQDNGKFSRERYEQAVRAQGMTTQGFEALLRGDMVLRQLTSAIETTAITPKSVLSRWQALQEQEREISSLVFQPAQFLDAAQVTQESVTQYYESNKKTFETPLKLGAEYLVLSIDKLAEQAPPVSEDEIRSAYEARKTQYQTPEERRASHILIAAPKSAPEAERAKARAKAEELLAQARKNPAGFADLARKNSQDPGSAAKGGDLGMFSRGMMVKPFDDAAFALKEGELSGVVESDFGFHIIKLASIKPAGGKPLSEVHAELEQELRKQGAQKKFTEIAETFSNLVYEQADSLQPAAERFKLTIQRTPMFAKADAASAAPVLNNDKLLNALFGDDAVKNKRNTEAFEVAPNTLVAARVAEAEPSRTKTLAETDAAIRLILRTKEAAKLAQQRAEKTAEELRKGPAPGLSWSAPKVVSRQNPLDLPPDAINAVFRADVSRLPAYATAEMPGAAYAVFRIASVTQPQIVDADKRNKRGDALNQSVSRSDFDSYLGALRSKTKVAVNTENLVRKER